MKNFLLSVLVIQLLAFESVHSYEKTTHVITIYKSVSLEKCVANSMNTESSSLKFTLENKATKLGSCQILSSDCDRSTELECKSCQRDGKVIIFWDISKSRNWIESYHWCISQGGRLAIVKDAEKARFLEAIAKRLIPNESAHVAFWLGFNRTSTSAPWKYVDGTPLGTYNNWAPGRPEGRVNCGEMSNTKKYHWKWDNDNCNKDSGWKYYPFCEVVLPFLEK